MNCTAPKSFVEVPKEQFDDLFSNINYRRDGYCGGVQYKIDQPGKPWPRLIGCAMDDGRFLIDPEFFKKP